MQTAQQHATDFDEQIDDDMDIDGEDNVREIPADDLPADEYLSILQRNVSDDMIRECFEELDSIEEQRSNLVISKKMALLNLENCGCHKQGILAAWNRYSKSKKDQEKIDATFARCAKVAGGYQQGLFD